MRAISLNPKPMSMYLPSRAAGFASASSQRLESSAVAVGEFDFAWSAWAYRAAGSNSRVIGSRQAGDDGGIDVGYDGTYWFATAYGPTGFGLVYSAAGFSPLNAWRHVAFWRTVSPNRLYLQIDGRGTTTSDDGGPNVPMPGAIAAGASPLHVGNVGTWGSRYWDGRIDSLGFWRRVLAESERASLFNNGRGRTYARLPATLLRGLVSWWDLGDSGDIGHDSHGAARLTPVNGPTIATGITGPSLPQRLPVTLIPSTTFVPAWAGGSNRIIGA